MRGFHPHVHFPYSWCQVWVYHSLDHLDLLPFRRVNVPLLLLEVDGLWMSIVGDWTFKFNLFWADGFTDFWFFCWCNSEQFLKKFLLSFIFQMIHVGFWERWCYCFTRRFWHRLRNVFTALRKIDSSVWLTASRHGLGYFFQIYRVNLADQFRGLFDDTSSILVAITWIDSLVMDSQVLIQIELFRPHANVDQLICVE